MCMPLKPEMGPSEIIIYNKTRAQDVFVLTLLLDAAQWSKTLIDVKPFALSQNTTCCVQHRNCWDNVMLASVSVCKVSGIYPPGAVLVCTTFQDNTSCGCFNQSGRWQLDIAIHPSVLCCKWGRGREAIMRLSSTYTGIITSFYTLMIFIESNFSETAQLEICLQH